MNYHIADSIIRIKNASKARRNKVALPNTKMVKAIVDILVKRGFLKSVVLEEQEGKKVLVGEIRYEKRIPVMTDAKIISKPSLRHYAKAKDMLKIQRRGQGIAIISTSKGVMTTEDAKQQGLGGELLFKIW